MNSSDAGVAPIPAQDCPFLNTHPETASGLLQAQMQCGEIEWVCTQKIAVPPRGLRPTWRLERLDVGQAGKTMIASAAASSSGTWPTTAGPQEALLEVSGEAESQLERAS